MADSMVVPGRAWSVEASMSHCVTWDQGPAPALPGRHYDGRAYARELVDLLRWGHQLGINGIDILHGERGGLADPGGLLLEQEAIALGLPFAVGGHVGHGFPYWLPAALLERRPQLGRLNQHGQRTPAGNFCTSDPEALGRALGELTLLLDRHPRARLLQIFPDDVLGGSWCHCPRCRERSAAAQYAALVAAAAGACDARRPGTEVGFLLYHDTLSGAAEAAAALPGGRLPPNVQALFAPRERCYAHAIDDAGCPRNQAYWNALRQALAAFDGRADVFEYYGDTILWRNFNVAIPRVIAADLRAYARLGVREVQALAFGSYSRWAHGLNLAVFGWLASGALTAVEEAVARYAQEWFGAPAAPAMVEYYDALEARQAGYLAFCPYPLEWLGDLRGPGAPSPHYAAHRRRAAACADELAPLAELLARAESACQTETHADRVRAERASLRIARLELELLDVRLTVGERRTAGGPADWTQAERDLAASTRLRQWELACAVPVQIRGQAAAALAG